MYRLDHVALQVRDLEASIAFYRNSLGLKLLFSKVDEAHGEAFAFLELEGGNLELLQALGDGETAAAPPAPRKPYCPHVALVTEDMDACVAELQQKGVPIVDGPLEIPGSVRWLYIADPDNNVLEFVQWL